MRRVDTELLRRLRARDEAAWYELWQIFGPALERMIERFSKRCFSPDTVRDVSQETLLRVSKEVHRFDPKRGTRFSTWLFQIAHHVVCGEFAFRNAKKRGQGVRPGALDPACEPPGEGTPPSVECERAIFRAKVYQALHLAEKRLEFMTFEIFKARVLQGMRSKDIAVAMGVSEPTVSRHLRKARDAVRESIRETVAEYSFTPEEEEEVARAKLDREDELFDSALADLYAIEEESRKGYDTVSRAVSAMRAAGR